MQKKLPNLFSFLALILLTLTTNAQTNYYVSASAGDNLNDGLSPATAKSTIAAAISAAANGDIINIGAGTYVQTTTLHVNKSLTIQSQGSIGSVTIQTSGGGLPFFGNSSSGIHPKPCYYKNR